MNLDNLELNLISGLDDIFRFKEWLGQRRSIDAIGFDTETTGLNRYSDKVRLIQFGDDAAGWAMDRDDWQGLARWVFANFEGDFIGHNAPFDCDFLENSCGINVPRHRVHDTLVHSAILEPHMSKALKNQAGRHVDPAAAGLQEVLKGTNFTWETVPTGYGPYWQYGALDPVLTYCLELHHRPLVEAEAPRAYEIEMAVLWVVSKMSKNGAYVDRPFAQRYLTQFEEYCASVETWCQAEYGVKPGSNAAIVAILQEAGYGFLKSTAAGAVALDAEVLEGIEHPLAVAVLNRRRAQKMASTYLRHYVHESDAASLIHPTFNTVGARTGRMSCSEPNLQNLPRLGTTTFGDVVRSAIKTRHSEMWDPNAEPMQNIHKHGGLMFCDFSQIEMRILAHMAQETAMINAFKAPDDFFISIARQIFQDDTITKKDKRRQITKNACVPLSSEILTREGWRKHNEVIAGNETLGYNQKTHQLEWTKITAVHHYANSEVITFGNKDRAFVTTPNHRWLGQHVNTGEMKFVEANNHKRHNIILAAELANHSALTITTIEAAVLGWVFGDGTIKQGTFMGASSQGRDGQKIKCGMSIGQIKPHWIAEIDDLLTDVPHKRYVSKRPTVSGHHGVTWVLNPAWARDLLRRVGLWQQPLNPWKLATSLSQEQRQAMIGALNAAEGCSTQFITMSQALDSPITELMIALGYTAGYFVRVHTREPDGTGWGKKTGASVHYQAPKMGPQRTGCQAVGREDVWCVTTDLGTWTMRQGHSPVLTGNSYAKIYSAGVRKFAQTAGIPVSQATEFLKRFDILYPNVSRFTQRIIDTAMSRRYAEGQAYVRSPLTNRKHVGDSRKEYALGNYLIQGTAAEINKLKLIELDAAGLGEWMFATVHDEVLLDVPGQYVDEVARTLGKVMNDTELLSLPITAEISFGERWGKKHDYVEAV